MVNYEILLDVKDSKVLETDIVLTQGDNTAVKFTIRVMNDGAAMTPSTAKIAFLSGGNVIAGDLSISGSVLTYVFQGNEITVPGRESATVVLTDSSGRVSAKAFVFEVAYNPLLSPSTPAGTYIPELEEIIGQAEEMIAALQADFPSAPLMKADILNAFTQSASGLYALDAVAGKTLYDNLSHRNLLDNGWFTVNQRGVTSGSLAGDKYYLDRWKMTFSSNAGSFSVSSSGLTLTPGDNVQLYQKFEDVSLLNGKVLTASVMFSNGTIVSGTITRSNGTRQVFVNESNYRFEFGANNNFLFVALTTMTIRAIKLEFGSVSTLANDTAPDYATELLKCQRQFVKFTSVLFPSAYGHTLSNRAEARMCMPLPTKMRTNPTMSVSSFTNSLLFVGNSEFHPTSASVESMQNNLLFFNVTCSATLGSTSSVCIMRFYADVSLSSEL